MSDGQAPIPVGSLSRLTRRQTWILTAALLLISIVWIAIDWLNRTAPVEPAHELAAGALQWQPLLALEEVTLLLPPVVVSDTLAFVGMQDDEEDPALTVLNLETGDVRWQLNALAQTRPQGWPEGWFWRAPMPWRWSGLMAADDVLYAVEAFFLETAVNAYSLRTGERLWHHKLGAVNGSDADYAALVEDRIGVRISQDQFSAFYLLDRQAGTMRQTRQGNAGTVFWMEKEPPRLYAASTDTISISETAPWQVQVGGCDTKAHLTAAVVLVRAQECGSRLQARLYGLDRQTGQERWRFDRAVVSNLAIDGSHVSFLTTGGQLLTLDAETGRELTVLLFTPNMLAFQQPDDETAASFFVAAHHGLLAVYFGDSRQLFAYRSLTP